MDIKNKKISILGTGKSGISAAIKAKKLGAKVFVSDMKSEEKFDDTSFITDNFTCEFGGHTELVLDAEMIIVSPGIPVNIPILQKAKMLEILVIGEIEFGFLIKNINSKIIAITGSNGKSTTVTLLDFLLKKNNFKTILAGNIGHAFTSFPIEEEGIDYIVLELSSFQLDLIKTFKPDIAAILNITPDHLNRYNSFNDYAKSKFRIFSNQDENDLAIINKDCDATQSLLDLGRLDGITIKSQIEEFSLKDTLASYYVGNEIISIENQLINISKRTILGPHNVANILAVFTILNHLKIDLKKSSKFLAKFKPLEHRLELVDEIDGVRFINDSKATNTDSVKYALNSFEEPVHLIIGGSGKGEDYSLLNKYIKSKCKKIYLIGASSDQMYESFNQLNIEIERFKSFENAIKTAFHNANKNEVILLSPACASYDMFKNFEDRGNQFKAIVREIKNA